MEDYFNNHDVLNDVRRLKKNCKNLDKEWDELKNNVENKYIQPDYRRMLCLVLGKADEAYQQPQRKRDRDNSISIVNIDDERKRKCRRQTEHCVERLDNQCGSGLCIRACDKGKNVVIGEQTQNAGVNHDDRPVTKNRLGRQRNVKWKDMVDGDNEDTLPTVRVDSENLCQENGLGSNRVKGKRVVDQVRLDEHNVKAHQSSGEQERYDNRDVIMVETSSNEGGDDDDVEILDDDAFRAISSFVPSKRFHKSMEDDDNTDFHHVGSMSRASDAFRKQVVEVLKKPFDKEELERPRKDVQDGSYYRHFPDLKSKLTKSRYKRGKCLNILRGFLFWVQNVAQEGAFKPWKDGRCLAVMPGNSPPPQSTNLNRAKESKRRIR